MERIDKIVTGVVVASYCTAPGPSGIINAHWVRNPRSNTIYPAPVDLTGRPLELDVYYPTQWNLQVLAAAASSSGANRRIFLLMWTAPADLAFDSDSDGHVSAGRFALPVESGGSPRSALHASSGLQASASFAQSPLRIQHWHPL